MRETKRTICPGGSPRADYLMSVHQPPRRKHDRTRTPLAGLVSALRGLFLLLPAWGAGAADAPITPEAHEFFEKRIRPTLASECYECHNADKHKGGLRLDYRDGWKKGGDSGDAIVPGNAAKSLLITAIRHEDPDLKMPAKAPKLDDKVIADFEKWVNMGAPDPRDQPPAAQAGKPTWPDLLAARREWWSLLPVTKPALPEVKDGQWSAHPVDRFLLARMEEHGLAPAPDADSRTVIRRLTFALTGLPPTSQEVEAFVKETHRSEGSHETYVKAVDRLLASPRFGEHWARHWLDLMRYAETHGSEGDPEIREAWRYRDYVIRAFNADIPADQLIREHLAGDLLPQPRIGADGVNESVLGTAQFRLVEHGFQPIDTLDDQVKAVDNQIDVVSKAFQGLTVSCARCHDHKFDAISQRDYYALYGIFASCRPAQVMIDAPEVQAKNRAALERLHTQIKTALVTEWLSSADHIAARLQDASAVAEKSRVHAAKIQELEKQISDLEWTARHALKDRAPAAARNLPSPIAAWSFEKDASDAFGKLNGQLEGGAEVRDGRLILDGKGAFLRSEPLPVSLTSKTFEAWVAPTTLEQRGGGIVSIESTAEHAFDSIVFAEKEPRRWVAGSDNFKRSESVDGPAEDAKPGELIHVAVVYGDDNRVTMYRNGVAYGRSYSKAPVYKFEEGKAHVLLGLRHKGAGSGYFAGEIEEARLYDRALSAAEIAASFRAGAVPVVTPAVVLAALTPAQRERRAALGSEIERLRAQVAATDPAADAWSKALTDAATSPANPLHFWAKLVATNDADFPTAWQKLTEPLRASIEEARTKNRENLRPAWNLAGADYAKWFAYGSGLTSQPLPSGQFSIEPSGDRILDGIFPGGAVTHRLSEKHNGLLTSPRFKIESDNISVRAFGSGGAMVRVIVDNYPLPSNPIYAKAVLDKDEPGWVRLDTAYRKGSMAYLEFATHEDLTRPLQDKKKQPNQKDGDKSSHYGVDQVVFHDGKEAPMAENFALLPLLEAATPKSTAELAATYRTVITAAIAAWRADQLTEPQRALLDALARSGVLPVTLNQLATVRPMIEAYRRLEAGVPQLRHAPGVIETLAYDAPLLVRGDHLKPAAEVPRGYLEVFGGKPYPTLLSGRRELADEITAATNPLTARVMANRVWHWLFAGGLVPTVDNFGRLGDKPTHPELLDYLAAHLVENHWSFKELIRYLVATRAFQMSSVSSPQASETDPANSWLSHMRVRRLEAEAIRDSLLAVAGDLDGTMFGKPADFGAPRRSVYLQIRRTNLNPFLQVFDAPKPFTTLGRRDATNVPAQSLTLLNSPFVIDQALKWSRQLVRDDSDSTAARIRCMFISVYARPPSDDEAAAAAAYLTALARDRQLTPDKVLANEAVWQDFAQSLFNLKEFIYLR